MCKVLNAIVYIIVGAIGATYAAPANASVAIADAASTNQFLLLTFYESDNAEFATMTSTVSAFNRSTSARCVNYTANVSEQSNRELANKYGIRATDFPIVLIIAPTGAITGGYPKNVTGDQLNQSVNVSVLMQRVLKSLQDQKVTLVALQNKLTTANVESWQGVNEFVNDTLYKKSATSIMVDPATRESQDFIKQCQIVAPLTQATVVVLMPPGRIGKIFTGKVTKDEIVKALASCASGCKPGGACSDRRFKENITPLEAALDKTIKLQGVTFTWKRDAFPERYFPAGAEIGFIAQDVEKVIPEVVGTDYEGYKSIRYDKLTATLVEAIKELKQKIDVQDSLINVQNNRILALERE